MQPWVGLLLITGEYDIKVIEIAAMVKVISEPNLKPYSYKCDLQHKVNALNIS